jgi:hypothetical protein
VALLDYVGFKLRVLLNAPSLNWATIEKTVEEAEHHWSKIEPRMADNGLRDAFRLIIAGMNKAAKSKNSEMAVFAAQVDLALVDLLERQFERIAKQK